MRGEALQLGDAQALCVCLGCDGMEERREVAEASMVIHA